MPPSNVQVDVWFDFGFVVCSNEHEERRFGGLYNQILAGDKFRLGVEYPGRPSSPTCPFNEFWRVWENGSLMHIFDKYLPPIGGGFDDIFRPEVPYLKEFLSYPGKEKRPSVWKLKHFLALENVNLLTTTWEIAEAAMEYGFNPTLNTKTTMDLRAFYSKLLSATSPIEVDKAKNGRKLHELAVREVGEVEEHVLQILRGVPYDVSPSYVLEIEV